MRLNFRGRNGMHMVGICITCSYHLISILIIAVHVCCLLSLCIHDTPCAQIRMDAHINCEMWCALGFMTYFFLHSTIITVASCRHLQVRVALHTLRLLQMNVHVEPPHSPPLLISARTSILEVLVDNWDR